MKLKLLTVLIFLGSIVQAQINITSADMPVVGDTLRFSVANPSATFLNSYQNTGANYTWNFSYLQPIAQEVEEFVPSSQTPYGFPNTIARLFADTLNIGGVEFTDIYEFRQMDSSSVQMVGRGISYNGLGFPFPFPVAVPYIDTGVVYQFPLTYNDRDSNYFMAEYSQPFLGVYYQAKGYRINHVDGYGQITTPYGKFNAIRVVTDIVETDTIHYDTLDYKVETHLREYKWLAKGIKYPVLQVTGTVMLGNFLPSVVSYRDSVRNLIVGVEEHQLENNFTIYPNPNAGNHFSIKMDKNTARDFKIDFLDISGKLIHTYTSTSGQNNEGTFKFDLPSHIGNGIYFIRIKSSKGSIIKELIVNQK